MKQAQTPEFVEYQKQTMKNASTIAKEMQNKGYKIVSGGTDNHLVLVNLKSSKVKFQLLCITGCPINLGLPKFLGHPVSFILIKFASRTSMVLGLRLFAIKFV